MAIPLLPSFAMVSGPNSSGKSNILDALLFCLGLSAIASPKTPSRLKNIKNSEPNSNKKANGLPSSNGKNSKSKNGNSEKRSKASRKTSTYRRFQTTFPRLFSTETLTVRLLRLLSLTSQLKVSPGKAILNLSDPQLTVSETLSCSWRLT